MDNQTKDKLTALLEQLNISEDVPYNCKNCRDVGYILVDGKAELCGCQQRTSQKKLPENLKGASFENFEFSFYPNQVINPEKSSDTYEDKAREVYNAAVDFVLENVENKSNGQGLFLSGPVGSGKTFLAAAIYNALAASGLDVAFYVVPELLEKSKEALFDETVKINIIDHVKKHQILILDDLGAHNYTPWTINQLYLLLNYRLNHQLPTVVTSNFSFGDIEAQLDDRIVSRLVELCRGCHLFADQDIRLKKVLRSNKNK